MIQPLHTYFFACTLSHRFLDEVPRLIRKQAVYPYEALVFGLLTELRLAVYGPAEKPRRVFDSHYASCNYFSAERISLAYILYIGDDPLI